MNGVTALTGSRRLSSLSSKLKFIILAFFATSGILYYVLIHDHGKIGLGRNITPTASESTQDGISAPDTISSTAQYFIDNPIDVSKPKYKFAEVGHRIEVLLDLIEKTASIDDNERWTKAFLQTETLALSLFPFLSNLSAKDNRYPLDNLRKRFVKGSKGIVIPCGKSGARFALHLVGAIREVLGSSLPIEITYAGPTDLPLEYQNVFSAYKDVTFTDITGVFDDRTLQLAKGGWAIKPFAALASRFEQVILLDADCVFLQRPESILRSYSAYTRTGALFFHDRLLWKGAFKERHDWWRDQMKNRIPSPALNKSLVWTEDYAEEVDSGVVVVDKSRLKVLGGLLHVCWQNTAEVRKFTYSITYGDKESWWFGFELAGAPYSFETHYGGIAGREREGSKVCSFNIAHPDERGELLWWNGGLLKNKMLSQEEFDVPTHFVVGGEWQKGVRKINESCIVGGNKVALDENEVDILTRTVDLAKKADSKYRSLFGLDKLTS